MAHSAYNCIGNEICVSKIIWTHNVCLLVKITKNVMKSDTKEDKENTKEKEFSINVLKKFTKKILKTT